jgi:hypothetical protein
VSKGRGEESAQDSGESRTAYTGRRGGLAGEEKAQTLSRRKRRRSSKERFSHLIRSCPTNYAQTACANALANDLANTCAASVRMTYMVVIDISCEYFVKLSLPANVLHFSVHDVR